MRFTASCSMLYITVAATSQLLAHFTVVYRNELDGCNKNSSTSIHQCINTARPVGLWHYWYLPIQNLLLILDSIGHGINIMSQYAVHSSEYL